MALEPIAQKPVVTPATDVTIYKELQELRIKINQLIDANSELVKRVADLEAQHEPN